MNVKKYAFFHGINSDGKNSVNRIMERLNRAGHLTFDADIPTRNIFTSNFTVEKDAERALRIVKPGYVLVAHSHGCNVAIEVARRIEVKALFLFNPASPDNVDFSELKGSPTVKCVYSPSDWIVRLGSWIPFSIFGRAGISGFLQLHEEGNPYGVNINVKGTDHDDAFVPPALWYWTEEIKNV